MHFIDPIEFVGQRLSDLDGLLASALLDPEVAGSADAEDLRAAVPEILDALLANPRNIAGAHSQQAV